MAVTGRYIFTQPETLLCVIAVVIIYFATHIDKESMNDVVLRFVHFTSLSLYVGMSFWVTFVAGLTMYRIVPRHSFSQIQCALFPKFVTYSLLFSTAAMVTFYLLIKQETNSQLTQMSGVGICMVSSILSCLVINPLINAIIKRNEMEVSERVGHGTGNDNDGCKKLLETNQTYASLYYRVVKLHGASALTNLCSVVGIAIHLSVLAYNTRFISSEL